MGRAEDLLAAWLEELGFTGDPEMAETAERFTTFLRGFRAPVEAPSLSTLPSAGEEIVALREIPFHSLCAHHLLPFFGTAGIAYRPAGRLAGFGGLARVVQHHAHRPQIQERMAREIAVTLGEALAPEGVVVRLVARQLCMEMRGARSAGEAEVVATWGEHTAGLLDRLR